MGRTARRVSLLAAAIAMLICVASCRAATEVVVDVRTNAAYRDGLVVSFTVGTPDEVENGAPTTESRAPWGPDGFVGSLTVVPRSGSNKDASLGVKIVLGIDRDSRSCAPPDYSGCIVARRRIVYSPHERLELPIALYVKCKDVACDAASTCNLLGQCVSATVDPSTCSSAQGCSVSGDPQASMPPPRDDAGMLDAAAEGATDAATDAADLRDGAVDAPPDAPLGGTPGSVDCPRDGSCNVIAGQSCCYVAPSMSGSCAPAGAACASGQQGRYSFFCDGNEDCAPQQPFCCISQGGTGCATSCNNYPVVCHSTKTCAKGACTGLFAGVYEICQ